jgi:acetoin utilization deacetylase AcuC-like enzyme
MVKKIKNSLEAIPVFYTEKMVADSESYSPSAAKPKAVVAAWQEMGGPISLNAPEPVTVKQLELAHEREYVMEVLTCSTENGFGNRSASVAKSLTYTSGAMLAAAREAITNRRVAVAPCSGFHHAGYDHGGGFCTFNGLMVAAMTLFGEGLVDRVGILDFDQHWGDGTQDIIKHLGVETCVVHYHPRMDFRGKYDAGRFLKDLPETVGRFADCDVVLYQAGADPHVADPLGGWLSTQQLQKRDRLVFQNLADLGIPVAWNLAGGYQRDAKGSIRPVLQIHENTMKECVSVYTSKANQMHSSHIAQCA